MTLELKQSEMLATLKELSSELNRYAAGNDSIVPGAYAEALDAAIEILDRIRWISVKDRLPENDNHVLCCTETKKGTKNVIIGYYMGGAWRCGMNSNVTHWMPLPELPGLPIDELKPDDYCSRAKRKENINGNQNN